MNLQENASHMLAKKLNEVIEPLCSGYSDYALLDFPAHSNVGDSAIYLGELALFDRIFNKPPSYVCTKKSSANDICKFTPEGIIFLHGGGNFGDIWPSHQKFFEKVLRQYPDKKIVQLPQSIHFTSKGNIERTAKAIRSHSDFTLLVRDLKSFEFANSHFDCDVKLCPDSAYALSNIRNDKMNISREVLCLLRSDKERQISSSDRLKLERLGPVEDWLTEKSVNTRTDRMEKLLFTFLPQARADLMQKKELMYRRHAQIRLDRGLSQLATANFVVTDRLHVHILSSLMKKHHFVLDNSYNKIQNYINAWPKDEFTHSVENIDDLKRIITQLS